MLPGAAGPVLVLKVVEDGRERPAHARQANRALGLIRAHSEEVDVPLLAIDPRGARTEIAVARPARRVVRRRLVASYEGPSSSDQANVYSFAVNRSHALMAANQRKR